MITIRFRKSKPRKPNARERELAAEWDKMMAAHSKPLGKGRGVQPSKITVGSPVVTAAAPRVASVKISASTPLGVAVVPVVDPLHVAKRDLRGRVGQAYNKGGLQYLTDDELAEQKTGSHKRRS